MSRPSTRTTNLTHLNLSDMLNVLSKQYKEPTTNKKVVNLSGYLSMNSGAASALHKALALFEKEWLKPDRKLKDEHFQEYARLKFMVTGGMNMPARDTESMEGNFLWTYAKAVYNHRDEYVSKFLEDAAKGNDALVLQLNVLRDDPERISRTKQDWETTILGARGLAAAMMDAFYDADKITVSPEQEMNLRRKVEIFTLNFNASLAPQFQAFDKSCKEHCEVISRLKGAGSEVCGRASPPRTSYPHSRARQQRQWRRIPRARSRRGSWRRP